MKRLINGKIEKEDFIPFTAFYTHIGLLNPTAQEEMRNYELPILF